MDWRNRRYFLVTIRAFDREIRIKRAKSEMHSFKMHSPYRHHKNAANKTKAENKFDYRYFDFYCEAMVSCSEVDIERMAFFLNDDCYSYMEITKEMCGQ